MAQCMFQFSRGVRGRAPQILPRRPQAGSERLSSTASGQDLDTNESRAALQAFFYGKAAGSVALERVTDVALDAAAELGRARAERLRILQAFPTAPTESVQQLLEDIRTRVPPSPDEVMERFAGLPEEVAERAEADIKERLGVSSTSLSDAEGEERANAVPDIPDVTEALDELRAAIAATRATLRQYSASANKQPS